MLSRLILIVSLLFCSNTFAQNYNLDFVSNLNYQSLHQANLNGCWGYRDETGTEYALVGTTKGTSVVSLADPANPVEVFWHPGGESIWRDIKVYGDYMYVTTEADDGLLIVDLSPLPQSTTLPTYFYFGAMGSIWTSAHNLNIDTTGGWAFICGANRGNGGIIILDIHSNPIAPIEVGEFDDYYCHDAFAQGNKLYGAHIDEGFFSIIDVTDHSNPVLVNTQITTSVFTHNIWATSDDSYVVTTDEVANAYLDFFDVSDPLTISQTDKVQSSPGELIVPHNSFIEDDKIVYTSYYADGVTVHDMTRPKNVVQVGWYDTYPDQNSQYNGCWGVYPYLPSGLVLASDMQMGLFVLNPNLQTPCYYEGLVRDASNLNNLNGVKVKILGEQDQHLTDISGEFYVGKRNSGSTAVIFSKTAYYPDTVMIDFQSGVVVLDTIDLVPIDPLHYTIIVTDALTGDPIIGANTRITCSFLDVDQLTDGFGESALEVYYPGHNTLVVGKWGYVSRCIDTNLFQNNGVINVQLSKGYYDDFAFDFGWTTTIQGAEHGFWERGIPFQSGINSVPQLDSDYDCMDYCFITGNAPTYDGGADDVGEGAVLLTSPTFDLTGYTDPYIYFQVFFFNWHGPGAFDDHLRVNLVNSSTTIPLYVSEDSVYYAAWEPKSYRVLDYSPLDSAMKLRVKVEDFPGSGNITEGAFDYFMVTEGSVLSNSENKPKELLVYPNPTHGIVSIYGVNPSEKLQLMNSLGQEVDINLNSSSDLYTLDLSGMKSGVYYLRNGYSCRKIVLN